MLNRLFKNDWTVQLMLILPLWIYIGVLLFGFNFASIPNYEMSHIFNFISKLLEGHLILGKTVILLQIIFQSFYISIILQKHEIVEKKSFLPSFIYALLIICFPQHLSFSPIHFSNTFLILLLSKTLITYEEESASKSLFTCALYAALSMLFFAPNIVFILPLIMSMIVFSNVTFKSLVAILLGFGLTYLYIFTYYYLNDSIANIYDLYCNEISKNIYFILPKDLKFRIFFFSAAAISGYAGLKLILSSSEKLIRIRKKHQYIFLFALTSFLGIFLSNYTITHQIGILFIGLTYVLSSLVNNNKSSLFSELILWALIIFSFTFHFLQLFH